jgi:hypothetical protein
MSNLTENKPSMSETPRTDEAVYQAIGPGTVSLDAEGWQKRFSKLAQHARQLERELAELKEHVGLCHDAIGESRDSDTSELWRYFDNAKQTAHRLAQAEDKIAAMIDLLESMSNGKFTPCDWVTESRKILNQIKS